MVCCVTIAALLGLFLRPVLGPRTNPLAWRPGFAPPGATSRLRSFANASAGLGFLVRNEPNMRIHLAAASAAIIAGTWLEIGVSDWRWLIVAMAMVLAAEALNTGVEPARSRSGRLRRQSNTKTPAGRGQVRERSSLGCRSTRRAGRGVGWRGNCKTLHRRKVSTRRKINKEAPPWRGKWRGGHALDLVISAQTGVAQVWYQRSNSVFVSNVRHKNPSARHRIVADASHRAKAPETDD